MMRLVLLLLLVTASAFAFHSSKAFIAKNAYVSSSQLASLNIMNEIKADFSGPNMMAGHPDDRPTMYPSKAGSLAFMEPQLEDFEDETETVTSPVLATPYRKKLGQRKSQWSTAVFWHEINLYGHTLASKGK